METGLNLTHLMYQLQPEKMAWNSRISESLKEMMLRKSLQIFCSRKSAHESNSPSGSCVFLQTLCTLNTAGAKQLSHSSDAFDHLWRSFMRGPYQTCCSGGGEIPGCVFFSFSKCQLLLFLLSFTVTRMMNHHDVTNGCYLIQIKQVFYHNVVTRSR